MWKADEEIGARLTKAETGMNTLSEEIIEQKEIVASLKLTIEGLKSELTKTGGSNLIRNSVGAFGNEYWEGTIEQRTDTDVMINNESKSAICLRSENIFQCTTKQ